MATQPKRAHTCKLRIKKDTSFLRFISPDWSILDVIGQTILLKELTGHFGSFQKACVALNLQDNEVESFLLTYLEYQKASDRGRIVAEKWGRDQAVPANADADIPQQRPLLICAASIAPACGFLESLGYQAYTPAVQSWTHRIITWPPFIDVADFDVLKLNQANFNFPTARKKPKLFKYEGSLGDDTRAMVALVGASQPKTGGTPDTRISFIDLPDRSVAYGPRGSRQLYGAGRYYVCWSTDELSKKQYSDLLSTRNNAGSKELGNSPVRPHGLEGLRDISTKDTLSPLAQEGGWDAEVQAKDADEGSLVTHIAQAEDLTVDPKDIFRKDIADVYDYEDEFTVPFRREDEPEGPLRKIANSELQRLSSTWPDQMFQFRLPRGYTIIGPLGDLHTFDLPQHETRDEMGHPRGMGGTYHIVPPQPASKPLNFKLEVLPDHVALRLNVPEKMIIIRNGTALPRFVEPGVHEWSTREGFLDFYSAHGCYDILQAESDRDALQELSMNSLTPEAYQADSFIRPTDHGEKRKVNPSPIEEAQEILAPHRDWLDREEAKEKQLERDTRESARLDAKIARDKACRKALAEEREVRKRALETRQAEEQARVNTRVEENTGISQDITKRRVRRKWDAGDQLDTHNTLPQVIAQPNPQPEHIHQQEHQYSNSTFDIIPEPIHPNKAPTRRGRATGAPRRKRLGSEDDDEYIPPPPRPPRRSRARGLGPTQKDLSMAPVISAHGTLGPQPSPASDSHQVRGTALQQAQAQAQGQEPWANYAPAVIQ